MEIFSPSKVIAESHKELTYISEIVCNAVTVEIKKDHFELFFQYGLLFQICYRFSKNLDEYDELLPKNIVNCPQP